jgi:hypothetical protein
MVLFRGEEFDADERPEVGGGDGNIFKAELSDVAIDLREAMLIRPEDGREQVVPVGLKNRCDFVGDHSEK